MRWPTWCSDRKAQVAAKPPHFDLGKSFDTFGPIGPKVVSLDGIGDPCELRIVTSVNGKTRQDDTVANMVFDVPTVLVYLSQITTLVNRCVRVSDHTSPGDNINSGS